MNRRQRSRSGLRWLAGAALAGPLALAACSLLTSHAPADAAAPLPELTPTPLALGAISHFGGGWPLAQLNLLDRAGPAWVRAALAWRAIEPTAGRYNLTGPQIRTLESLCRDDRRVLLLLEPRHPLYDHGQTAFTPAARAAFGRFAAALADRLEGCVGALEIGNEINGAGGMTGAAAQNRPRAHVELLKAIWSAVKPAHPDMLIVGGSVHSVATGFLADIFAAGGLEYLDAVALHPYRRQPDNLDWELARLRQAMLAAGQVRPVWATEFGQPKPGDLAGPDMLLETAALLSSAGVPVATWYALIDDRAFPTMGLFTTGGAPKPEAGAFAFAKTLLARGPARRIDEGSGVTHIMFGAQTHLLWGAPRTLTASGEAEALDSQGRRIPMPGRLSDKPVVIEGTPRVTLAGPVIHADSLTDYAREPWSYSAESRGGVASPLTVRDWTWTSYLASSINAVTAANQTQVLLGGAGRNAAAVRIRYTAERAGNLWLSGCLARTRKGGDGAIVAIEVAGSRRFTIPVAATPDAFAFTARVEGGDTVDFLFDPKATTAADVIDYRLRVAGDARANLAC